MPEIKLRLQRISDAKRFYQILNNPNFIYFEARPKSIKDEKKWLRGNPERQKSNTAWNYAILFQNEVAGAIGVRINYHRKYIGEIGYFIDEKFWGKGIVTAAIKLIEDICFNKLKLNRIEILMQPENKASEKAAIKNGYLREGLLRKVIQREDKERKDCYLYAKTL